MSDRNLVNIILECLKLLTTREKFHLCVFVIVQLVISFLDIIAVVLSGVLSLQIFQVLNGNQSNTVPILPQLFDGILKESSLFLITLATLFFFVVRTISSILANKLILNYLSSKTANLSLKLLRKFYSIPLDRQQKYDAQATLYGIMDGVDRAILGTIGTLIVISVDFLSSIFLITLLLIVSPGVAISMVLYFAAAMILLNVYSSIRIRQFGDVKTENNILIKSKFLSIQDNFRELFVSGKLRSQVTEIEKLKTASTKATADQILISNLNKYLFETIVIFAFALFLGFQAFVYDSMPDTASVGMIGASVMRLIPSLLRIHQGYLEVMVTRSEANRAFSLINSLDLEASQPTQEVCLHQTSFETFKPEVEFKDVSFAYNDRFEIEKLNFKVKGPSLVALIGENGSGKSTILDLISGVIEPNKGIVSVSSERARTFVQRNPGKIGYVPQEINMFGATIMENLLLQTPQESTNGYRKGRAKYFHLQIELDANVERLSGGERQRMSLTRADLLDSEILLLDEPTSAMDSRGEEEFQNWIELKKKDKLIFVVAHRFETLRQADVILFLERGRVIHQGNLATSKAYVNRLRSTDEIF